MGGCDRRPYQEVVAAAVILKTGPAYGEEA
jgi:hypothetical protein